MSNYFNFQWYFSKTWFCLPRPLPPPRNDTALQMTVTDSSVVEMILLEIVTASLERDNMTADDWHQRVTCYGTYNLQETLDRMEDLASSISAFCRFVEQTDSAVVLEVRVLIRLSMDSA